MIMFTNLQLIRGRDYSIKHHSQELSHGKRTQEVSPGSPVLAVRNEARVNPLGSGTTQCTGNTLELVSPKQES